MKRFWEFRAQAGDTGELLLYGDIGDDGWSDVGSKEFAEGLKALGTVKKINVRINSPGGGVFAGQAIYSSLRRHAAEITIYIDGLAASIASVIAMAGDKVIMPKNSIMMIHNPTLLTWGGADQLRKDAGILDKVRETMIAAYRDKTGLSDEDIIELLDDETWMTAQDAVDWGFADAIEEEIKIAASISGDMLMVRSSTGEARMELKSAKIPEKIRARLDQKEAPASVGENEPKGGKAMEITLEILAEQAPDLLQEIRNQAAKEERERIQALDDLGVPGMEEILSDAKFGNPITAEQAAVKILAAQKAKGKGKLEDLRKDAKGLEGVDPGATDLDGGAVEEKEREKKASAIAKGFARRKAGN